MNAKQVVDKILSEANAEADKIKTEAQEKANAEKIKLNATIAEFGKQSDSLAVAAGQDKEKRVLAAARMDIAKETLKVKTQLLDNVFTQASEEIKQLSDDDYLALMEKLICAAVETGDEEIVVGKTESRINDKFIRKLKGNLTLANDRANIEGGFIVRRGKIKINVSLGVLLAQAREELETKLAAEILS